MLSHGPLLLKRAVAYQHTGHSDSFLNTEPVDTSNVYCRVGSGKQTLNGQRHCLLFEKQSHCNVRCSWATDMFITSCCNTKKMSTREHLNETFHLKFNKLSLQELCSRKGPEYMFNFLCLFCDSHASFCLLFFSHSPYFLFSSVTYLC